MAKDGNAGHPSDTSYDTPVIPTALSVVAGSQSWPTPRIVVGGAGGRASPLVRPSRSWPIEAMPIGTPGGTWQAQAMLQVFLNMTVFDMNPQQAVEAPRFVQLPDSFEPHGYSPGVLHVESACRSRCARARRARPQRRGLAGARLACRRGACCARTEQADLRRRRSAVGW
jgi:gamma-glutamyltranspeptidase/glutathione hydrolase